MVIFGQVKIENSQLFTKEDGLPSSHIRSIAEDQEGFIWIGTGNGLSRYDGSQFKNFFHDPTDSTSIFDNSVRRLLIDSTQLWACTSSGLSKMDLRTEKFINYQFQNYQLSDTLRKEAASANASCLEQATNGDLWIGTRGNGIFKYLAQTDTFINFRYPQALVKHFPAPDRIDDILYLKADRFADNILWVSTAAGLLKMNTQSQSLKWYVVPEEAGKNLIDRNALRYIYQHDNGLLYLCTWRAGVLIFNPKTETFRPLAIKNPTKEARLEGEKLLSHPIGAIHRKSEHEVWITSKGLMAYDTQKERWTALKHNVPSKGQIYGIATIDSQQRTWFHTATGLHLFDPLQQQLVEYNFRDLNPDLHGFAKRCFLMPDGKTIATIPQSSNGFFFLNTQNNTWTKKTVPASFQRQNGDFYARGFYQSPSSLFNFYTSTGILTYSLETDKFQSYPLPEYLKGKSLRKVLLAKNQDLWIGSQDEGLFRWNVQQNNWQHYKSELEPGQPPQVTDIITMLFEDSQGNIWINRDLGVSVYHTLRDTFYNFFEAVFLDKTAQYRVHHFAEDRQGRVWMSTDAGLLAYTDARQPEKGIVKNFNLTASYGINGFYYLNIDDDDNLWGIGKNQLLSFNPKTQTFKQFDLKYGVTQEEIFDFKILKDGRFILGGRNTVWLTHPKDLKPNEEKPIPYLTGISILQEPLKTAKAIHLIPSLDLNHSQNFFSFEFSAIGFTRGKETQFRYKLVGFDEHWSELSQRRFANFTNVPSGDYVFQLQAANNDGLWNEEILELPVYIATPWWKTAWFYGLTLAILLLIAYSVYSYRTKQIRKEEQLKSTFEKKLLEVEMSGLRAQMNPHFLFNSLNSIQTFIIMNEPQKAIKYLSDFARLIRLILQNSRANYITLEDEIRTLTLYIKMESLRFKDKFQYQISVHEDIQTDAINIPPMLIQPYVENAIWHGLMHKKDKKNGLLSLQIKRQNGYLICTIKDNGIGRAAAEAIKARRPKNDKKSIGMKITKDRIDMINQLYNTNTAVEIIDLVDEVGKGVGTKVILKILI